MRHPAWLFGGIPGGEPHPFGELSWSGSGEVRRWARTTCCCVSLAYASEGCPEPGVRPSSPFRVLHFDRHAQVERHPGPCTRSPLHFKPTPAPWLSAKIFLFPVAGNWLARWANKGAFVLGHIAFENLAESIQTESGGDAKLCRLGGLLVRFPMNRYAGNLVLFSVCIVWNFPHKNCVSFLNWL